MACRILKIWQAILFAAILFPAYKKGNLIVQWGKAGSGHCFVKMISHGLIALLHQVQIKVGFYGVHIGKYP